MPSRETCDVLVVGGGPAGSTCARALRSGGLDVIVMDAKPFPRDKICAGWITPPVLEMLEIAPEDYASGRTLQPITGFLVGTVGDRGVELPYGRTVSYGIRRREFDHYLLDRSGARLRLGERISSLERLSDGWVANGRIHARMLVGAGGHFCPVARRLNPDGDRGLPVVAAQEIEFPLTDEQAKTCRVRGSTPELYFCPDFRGYGWCFRKGGYLNVGLGREDRERLPEHVRDFCRTLARAGRIPTDLPDAFGGHAYLLYRPEAARRIVGDGVLLAGDAAGLAYPQSGEGIRTAVESGLLAARVVVEAAGDYRLPKLEDYAQRIRRRFAVKGTGPGVALPAGVTLPAGLQAGLGRMLLASRWFSRHVVIDRWFLHAGQPALTAG